MPFHFYDYFLYIYIYIYIIITGTGADHVKRLHERNKGVIFENCTQFIVQIQ